MIITIDGLGVNGKSTLAQMIADKLKIKNFNTGAIYRCIALEIINKKLDINNINVIIDKLDKIKVDFCEEKVFLDNKDVTKEIRTEEISVCSTKWGSIPEIKEIVRKIQKEFIKYNDTVMEGRDIGTRIATDADVKFYLYSDFQTRVKRLWNQNKNIKFEEIEKNLILRDDIDINGKNFIKPIDAIEIDTTNKTIDEVFEIMIKEINRRKLLN